MNALTSDVGFPSNRVWHFENFSLAGKLFPAQQVQDLFLEIPVGVVEIARW
jgi:hypothetical protein